MRMTHSPLPILCGPLDPDGVGEDGAKLALRGNVNWLGRALRFNSWLVSRDWVRQLYHLSINMDV